MSTIATTNIKEPSSATNNITLTSGGDTTISGNATISGLTYPTADGTANQVLTTNGSGTLSFADRGRMVLETAQATTSGTSVDFTGIPSWVKKITVMFNGVSTSGTSQLLIQLGDSGGVETTGYNSGTFYAGGTSTNTASSTAGFIIEVNAAAGAHYGPIQFTYFGSNSWHGSGWVKTNTNTYASTMGEKTLSDTLTQVRLTTVNGTDTFDAGSINLLLEG